MKSPKHDISGDNADETAGPIKPSRSRPKSYPMQNIVRLQRLAHRAEATPLLRPFARLIDLLIRLIYSATLPSQATIHQTAHFGHNALAVVINRLCIIGENCYIGPQTVLGGRAPVIGAPKLERDVTVHAGAKIIGPITVGEGSIIGANAVVLKDVPPFSVAVGVPARIIASDIDPASYR